MYITTNNCDGRSDCIKNCPTQAIRLIEDKAFSCITCGACFDACPNNAIFKNKYGGYVVDRTKCNTCGVCLFTCPVNSIHIEDEKIMGICSRCGVCEESCEINARVDGFEVVDERQLQLINSFADFNISSVDDKKTNKSKIKPFVERNAVTTKHEDCILCGRCEYYCPTNAIELNLDSEGKCTSCRVCSDVCPVDAITKGVIDNTKCTNCFNCLKACPNNAITIEDSNVFINLPNEDVDYKEKGSIVSCLNCGLCVDNIDGDSLIKENKKIKFNPTIYDSGDAKNSIESCPVGTLKEGSCFEIGLEGYCVLCGKCVEVCDYFNAREFSNFKWDGEVSDDCISCGFCAERCPKDAITLKKGKIILNTDKCILCETCAISCPTNAIPTTTLRKINIVGGFSYIDPRICIKCNLCSDICPEDAISQENNELVINEEKCIYCGACYNICPARAILFDRKLEISK